MPQWWKSYFPIKKIIELNRAKEILSTAMYGNNKTAPNYARPNKSKKTTNSSEK